MFLENPDYDIADLVRELTRLLKAEVIIIPSLKSDMTGHADGLVRFVDEHMALATVFHQKTVWNNGSNALSVCTT